MFGLRTLVVSVLLVLLTGSAIPAEELQTLKLSFDQKTRSSGTEKVAQGILCYEAPNRAVVRVDHPLSQVIELDGHMLQVSYPDRRRAFRFHAKRRFPLPVLDAVLLLTQSDAGLSEHGFTLLRHARRGDVVLTHWQPPESLAEELGPAILGTVGDRIVSLEHRFPDDSLRMRFTFRDHFIAGMCALPLEVSVVVHDAVNGFRHEQIRYRDVEINEPLPDWFEHVSLPDGVSVKVVEW